MELKFYIKTFGCQMNKYDSDSISRTLIDKGYHKTDNLDNAQIILVNTCVVRQKAEEKALSFIGRLASLKRINPGLIIGVIGCAAQEKGMDLSKRFPCIDLILGPRNIYHIDRYIAKIMEEMCSISSIDLDQEIASFPKSNGRLNGEVTSFLKIMEGCDNFCSYCIVPFVRGRESSLPAKDIIERARYLVSQGIREITLIGQNVNSYNVKNSALPTFPGLLEELDRIEDLSRLRFTTSHPKDISDELIFAFGKLKSLCPHIHLPVQSGSDNILKLMNRGYTRDKYLDIIKRLKEVRPDIAVTSDIMVGFPGEKEEDFQDSLRLIEEVQFDNLFSFKYSERPTTQALHLHGKIEENEKQRRLSILQSRQKEITLSKNKQLEGTFQEILVEGLGKRKKNQQTGRTLGNKVVNFSSTTDLKGQSIMVYIVEAYQNSLAGELASSRFN